MRDLEREAAKVKRGQILPDGDYLDEWDSSIFPCCVRVEDGKVFYIDDRNYDDYGPATKTNVKSTIAKTKAYLRYCKTLR
jgi:hypothetical protein|nr:hypothetical protein [uncultured Lachnoclostridium sp.]